MEGERLKPLRSRWCPGRYTGTCRVGQRVGRDGAEDGRGTRGAARPRAAGRNGASAGTRRPCGRTGGGGGGSPWELLRGGEGVKAAAAAALFAAAGAPGD